MKKQVIIVAGGSGKRMKANLPKQFLTVSGKPVLMHTIERFVNFDPAIDIIVVLPEHYLDFWESLCNKFHFTTNHKTVTGGITRFHSVKNGLRFAKENTIIAIHDGARPLVSVETLKRCFEGAEKEGNAVPAIGVDESIRKKNKKGNKPVNRKKYVIIQTPQCFKAEIITNAYKQDYHGDFTDDATVVEKTGVKINLVEGNIENIKLTRPFDLKIAEMLLEDELY